MIQFKTQSKRILELMINSIYTNKEIFLRELISNASDAIDKLHFKSLTDSSVDSDFKIRLTPDKVNKTLVIEDNGIGMTREDLEKNLGTIAESGTLAFKKEQEEKTELIGQFGVGFYSAFMVASKVVVETLAYGSDKAYKWVSEGVEGYEIEECDKTSVGTKITVYFKENDEDCQYDQFTEDYYLRSLVKKYSDYIRYPIVTDVTRSKKNEDGEGETQYVETETLNSMTPVWKKAKSDITKEEYDGFYASEFYDYQPPAKVIHANIEGNVNYTALLFVPSSAPADYYTKDFKKGLQLYSNGVLITEKCEELLPDFFGFIKGVVDSGDLSLNISREMLQKDRQLKAIANGLEKKIINEFTKMLENDRETYDKIFEQFGLSVKFGIYNNFGMKKDALKDIVEFRSSTENKLVTLKEYVSRMKEGQEFIYYACGDDYDSIEKMPQAELVRDKGFEILYFKDSVDEFVTKVLDAYDGKKFKNVAGGDLDLATEEEKKQFEEKKADFDGVAEYIKNKLGDKVVAVKFTDNLKSSAVCMSYEGEVSLEMEKVFKSMKNASPMPVEAKKVLEININHSIANKLKDMYGSDKDKLDKYAEILYTEALMLAGFEPEDVNQFAALVNSLL